MRYIGQVQFEFEAHDVYANVGQPINISVDADSLAEAKVMLDRHAQANPVLRDEANAWRILAIRPWGRALADIDRFNLVFTRTIRHAVGTRVGLGDSELSIIIRGAFATAVDDANRKCDHCAGSGEYWVRAEGFSEHGKYNRAVCFRCGGKGRQSDDDRKRNWGYDQNRPIYL